MMRLMVLGLTMLGAALAVPAWACGACVSPTTAMVQQTVVQDAERVLFVRDEKTGTSHVWVEVRYSGLATDFGWVLPLPKVPKVGVGSRMLFDQLDQSMGPRYILQDAGKENCRDAYEGCEPMAPDVSMAQDSEGGFADSWAVDSPGGGGPPTVEILAQGSTGPYDYSVIKGSESAALYSWLTTRGYKLPEKAKPILQSHIAKGDVFVAIKLSNGQGIQDIRPIVLEMPDAEPCVPLRLTSIAAKEDLSVVVTVAGKGRAVVKNHLDIVPNPMLMTLYSVAPPYCNPFAANCDLPSNYKQLVSAAIDSVGGHAFVTESSVAGNSGLFQADSLSLVANAYGNVATMAELSATLAGPLAGNSLALNEEVAEAIALPLALTQTFPGVNPLQTLANLKACGVFWQMGSSQPCNLIKQSYAQLQQITVNGKGAKAGIDQALVQPLAKIQGLIGGSARVTRLAMRISPEEMDRDPVFAFNDTLPVVPRDRYFQRSAVCLDGWTNGAQGQRYSWDGLGSWVFTVTNPQDPRFVNAPLVLQATLQDEQGTPLIIDPSQYELVDTAILGALPGKPSLPKDMVLKAGITWMPPPSDPLVTAEGPWKKPGSYCTAKPGWADGKKAPKPGEIVEVDQDAAASDSSDGQAKDGGALSDAKDGSDATGGPVPGIDAAGGWAEVDAGAGVSDVAPVASKPAVAEDSGCQAGAGMGGGWWMAALLAGGVARRRRSAAAASGPAVRNS